MLAGEERGMDELFRTIMELKEGNALLICSSMEDAICFLGYVDVADAEGISLPLNGFSIRILTKGE
jgi:hypothetical protein